MEERADVPVLAGCDPNIQLGAVLYEKDPVSEVHTSHGQEDLGA